MVSGLFNVVDVQMIERFFNSDQSEMNTEHRQRTDTDTQAKAEMDPVQLRATRA